MPNTTSSEPRALFSADGKTWHDGSPVNWEPDESVVKFVIGTPLIEDERKNLIELSVPLPDDLLSRFPNLTHLHLWQISNLTVLPELPDDLRCLDVQGCEALETVHNLPQRLDTLVLDGGPKLKIKSDQRSAFKWLNDLSLRDSISVNQAWIRETLENSRAITKLDLSGCTQLERIDELPPWVRELRLNECSSLQVLPQWPTKLRRLEMRHAERIQSLNDFPDTLDYIDLAWTKSLQGLPAQWNRPRTLFLYGSGVLEPPASEHGEHDKQNVAADVRAYFDDIDIVGKGTIKRCKLLILGNGEAGKTCLSYNLINKDCKREKEAGRLESTHGIQFWDIPDFKANVDTRLEPVHLHIWDFGGQEIYHNTHRLFINKGTVFVIVWNPAQDGQQAPDNGTGFIDEWRPLQYWIDLIRFSCDHDPRFAIVCSHHPKRTEELEQRWKSQVRKEFHDKCECFYIDSWEKTGERKDLVDWLQDKVGEVIKTQGTVVPSYWEIAQELVEGWLARMTKDEKSIEDEDFVAKYNALEFDQFQAELGERIREVVSQPRFEKLKQAITESAFELTTDRARRTLNFLTRSGWLYWAPALFNGQVIVGQQWALDGLYAALERRRGTMVYDNLMRSDGRFTRSDLNEWVWKDRFSEKEQQLLISFMSVCGLCFRLRPAEDAWREEDVYVSFEHLPTCRDLELQQEFDSDASALSNESEKIPIPYLHKHDWQTFLADVGKRYGASASYASDALMVHTVENELILIRCWINRKKGIGGEIEVQVIGNDARRTCAQIVSELHSRFPEEYRPGGSRSTELQSLSDSQGGKEVFISYAWNSASCPDENYEAPADAIEELLKMHRFQIKTSQSSDNAAPRDNPAGSLSRDKSSLKRGDSIVEFMKNGSRSPHVIMIHSDRYWMSVNCLYELFALDRELKRNSGKSFAEVVIPIEHPTSGIRTSAKLNDYLQYWDIFLAESRSVPSRMLDVGWTPEVAVLNCKSLTYNYANELSELADLNVAWSQGPEKVLEYVRQRIGLPTRPLESDGQ